MIEDIEQFQRALSRSLAVPLGMIRDEVSATAFATSMAQIAAASIGVAKAFRATNIYLDDFRRSVFGLPPVSAVDRLADLLREDDDGA